MAIMTRFCWAIATRTSGGVPLLHRTRDASMCHWFSTSSRNSTSSSSSDNTSKQSRPDPFARRPNQKCDPYGQGGKPLSALQAEQLLPTLHPDWVLQGAGYQHRGHPHQFKSSGTNEELSTTTTNTATNTDNDENDETTVNSSNDGIPTLLRRSFVHPDFMAGASFLNHMAAVAQMNDHYPSLSLERQLDSRRKQWMVISSITCHTFVLQGLSHHDFFVATLVDVEVERPEVKQLLVLE